MCGGGGVGVRADFTIPTKNVITLQSLTLTPFSWPRRTNKENPNSVKLIRKFMVFNITTVETIFPLKSSPFILLTICMF